VAASLNPCGREQLRERTHTLLVRFRRVERPFELREMRVEGVRQLQQSFALEMPECGVPS
jgi:hypothetical protein